MKSLFLLLVLPLVASCGLRTIGSVNYDTLAESVTECVDLAWGDVKDTSVSGGHGGGGNSAAKGMEWSYKLPLSEAEMADRLSNMRALLLTKLEAAGANIHGRGTSGNPEELIGFSLDYTSSGEEGMVWARRVSHGDGYNTIFIVFHGANID